MLPLPTPSFAVPTPFLPSMIDADRVPDLVSNIYDEARDVPLVIMSPTARSTLVLDPKDVRAHLGRKAAVVSLADAAIAEILKDTRELAVWGGAVRVVGLLRRGSIPDNFVIPLTRFLAANRSQRLQVIGRFVEICRQGRICSPARPAPRARPPAAKSLRTVAWAVREAARDCANLVLPPGAVQSAEQSPFCNPLKVRHALDGLDAAAAKMRTDRGQGWKQALGGFGSCYRNGISGFAAGKYGSDYVFRHEGQDYFCTEHMTLGSSMSAQACISIHWAQLPDGRLLVPYVGRHLRNSLTN